MLYSLADFRAKTEELFHSLDGQSAVDIEKTVYAYVQSQIDEYGLDAQIVDVVVSGSRCRGIEQENSDLDVVVEYTGSTREDDLFNMLHEDSIYIAGIQVDINPITESRTGTLETYLPEVETYLQEKAQQEQINNQLVTQGRENALEQQPEKEKISIKVQLRAVMQNRPYILALIGQVLFGFTLYGRNADVLYYFTYVEGNASYYTTYSMCIIIPSIIGAACFQPVFRKLNNKGRTASIFALLTGISMLCMFFFNVKETPAAFYTLAGITQFFFSGFNTAIYAIIPDCVEYGEWKTGLRNDGFQYAFVSLGNKIGMAIGTALLAALLGKYGYVANQVQNPAVLSIMRHSFTTIPGILWIVTAIVLFFYRLNKKRYNEIVEDLKKNRVK